ncbi:helix-turn-helix transcriptional regulator [Pseudomonas sp. Teo4]|uniref:AraC family transcriptional regulator n=1 Tax=Pseudomonas sp. Teo4 TaxID=3064528 RepID=UPI002AB9D330|nr:helix-turn-helix transcriptional regulator [Pseudomonas sp. Teo4]MDZ3992569.1 HTH-type transcriptional regulator NimR [Pseudomonas sp. Teo4]
MQNNEIVHHRVKITPITYFPGQTTEMHCHRRGQLVYAVSGIMDVSAHNKLWRIPPQRAVWIPPQTAHSMMAHGTVELRTLYTDPETVSERFCISPIMISVSPLLRELVLRGIDGDSQIDRIKEQVSALALTELELLLQESQGSLDYTLPLPSGNDKRLAQICSAILRDPGHPYGLEEWAQKVFTSRRTLARRFQAEFGMSFLNWRQQVRLVAALSRLDQGDPVTVIANDLGYETPASFSLMFRKLTGRSPSSYASVAHSHHH